MHALSPAVLHLLCSQAFQLCFQVFFLVLCSVSACSLKIWILSKLTWQDFVHAFVGWVGTNQERSLCSKINNFQARLSLKLGLCHETNEFKWTLPNVPKKTTTNEYPARIMPETCSWQKCLVLSDTNISVDVCIYLSLYVCFWPCVQWRKSKINWKSCFSNSLKMYGVQSFQPGKSTVQRNH